MEPQRQTDPGYPSPRETAVALKQFQRPEWIYHHPISDEQLDFAGVTDTVKGAGFNHGVFLYLFFQTPGVLHEQCLESAI
jgi:hypothetical protein